ncbi:adenosine receptor A2a-like [Nematostella vectensis]|uniref:adenosine receptor A2a-like n=1 Tax=Nematostella vectensis TaxID=45351 RepID=UPI0013903B59|nr:adenosine receptor A2a-like [Nematostella vectensis]
MTRHNTTNQDEEAHDYGATWFVLTLALVLPNLIGNTLVCLTIAKTNSLHNFCNFLLINLAISDMCLGFLELLKVVLLRYLNIYLGALKVASYPFIEVSIFTVTAISCERYTAIVKPFKLHGSSASKKLRIVIPLLWFLGFVLNIPAFVMFSKAESAYFDILQRNQSASFIDGIIHFLACYFLPSLIMWYTLLRIFLTLQNRKTKVLPQSQRFALKVQQKVVKLLGLVILAHNICFLPFSVVSLLSSIIGTVGNLKLYIVYYIQFASPVLNPLIYWAHSNKFRDAFVVIVTSQKRKQSHSARVSRTFKA